MPSNNTIQSAMLDMYFRELAKEYRKRLGKSVRAELILIGGASILINYGFREMTEDIDAYISAPSVMKDAIRAVGDRFALPNGWLNADFMKTNSFSWRLLQYSSYYKTFLHVLEVRTVKDEYLIAMKLVAGRNYKHDLSDIIGIIATKKRQGEPLSFEQIDRAVHELYGNWDTIAEEMKRLLTEALGSADPESLLMQAAEKEEAALVRFRIETPTKR